MMRVRWSARLLRVVLVPLLCAPVVACAQRPSASPARESVVLRSIARQHPCRARLRVETIGDSIPHACALAAAALDAVVHGRARAFDVAPGDSAHVTRAVVTSMRFADPATERTVDAYWSVVLVLENRAFALGARVDQGTGAVVLGKTERPPTSKRSRSGP